VDFLKERFKEKKYFSNEEHKGLLKKVRQKFKGSKKEPKVKA
jgi:hypothetical protein